MPPCRQTDEQRTRRGTKGMAATTDLLIKVMQGQYHVLVFGPGAEEMFGEAHGTVGNGVTILDEKATVDDVSEEVIIFVRNFEKLSHPVLVKLLERLARSRNGFKLLALTGSERTVRRMFDGALYNKFDHYCCTGGRRA